MTTPSTAFETVFGRMQQNILSLEEQLENSDLPAFERFEEINTSLTRLKRNCPSEWEADLRDMERRFNNVQMNSKQRYVDAIDAMFETPERLLDEESHISRWIDILADIFTDAALATEKRNTLNKLRDNARANRLLHDVRATVQSLWDIEQQTDVVSQILKAYKDAEDISREKLTEAQQMSSGAGNILEELRSLHIEARRRNEDVRKRFDKPLTLDSLGNFRAMIEDFEELKAENPDTRVYYVDEESTFDQADMMPVTDALTSAYRRWGNFIQEKATKYLENAHKELQENKPEEADRALQEFWKLDVPAEEDLLDVDRSPVEISSDVRLALRKTMEQIRQELEQLQHFRSQLRIADSTALPKDAWKHLVEAEKSSPRFVGSDVVWREIQPRILSRYRDQLTRQLDDARTLFMQANDQGFSQRIKEIKQAVKNHTPLADIQETAQHLQNAHQDMQHTLETVQKKLASRQIDDAREAQQEIQSLYKRLNAVGLTNVEPVELLKARVEAIIESQVLLSRLQSQAQSDNLTILQQALNEARTAAESIVDAQKDELIAITELLEKKISLTLASIRLQDGDLQRATQFAQEALGHEKTRQQAQQIIDEIQRIEQADEEISIALEVAAQQAPCMALNTLRPLSTRPSRLRKKLNETLLKVETQCQKWLEDELSKLRQQTNFDVGQMREHLATLESINAQRANILKEQLAPIMANREAMLAWDNRQWTRACERWEHARQFDEQYTMHYQAARKQEVLESAGFAELALGQTISDLEQYLARDLPGDPHILMELAQARLLKALKLPWNQSEELFSATLQSVEMVLQRVHDWMKRLPSYEEKRQQLLTQLREPPENLQTLVERAQKFNKEIKEQKIITREKGLIERSFRARVINGKQTYSLLGVLRAGEKYVSLQERPRLQQNQVAIDRLDTWWQDLKSELLLELDEYLFQVETQATNLRGSDGLPVSLDDTAWEELEARLILLVIEPKDMQGRKAVNELIHQTNLLYQQFELEQTNTSGSGFAGEDKDILDKQIAHLNRLSERMHALQGALDYLASHNDRDDQIQPPNSTWQNQRDMFYRNIQDFQRFLTDLQRFKRAKEAIELQMQTALGSGDWTIVNEALQPDDAETSQISARFEVHRTFHWLSRERDRLINLRERQVRRRDEVLWCLTYQQDIDAVAWDAPLPEISSNRLDGREWATVMYREHRVRAKTPVEVYSLIELARDRLQEMQREDPGDQCNLDNNRLEWNYANKTYSGIEGILQALDPLIEQLDMMRLWMHPLVGGHVLTNRAVSANGEASTPQIVESENSVNWQQIRQSVDKLRCQGKFDFAIKLCKWAINYTHHEEMEEIEPLLTRNVTLSLTQTELYLKQQNPLKGKQLLTGMVNMLVAQADSIQQHVQQALTEATNISKDLENKQRLFTISRNRFNAALEELYRAQSWLVKLPLIGDRWQRRTSEALTNALQRYKECYSLCPNAPVLRGRQIIEELQITDDDRNSIVIEQLFPDLQCGEKIR